MSNSPVTRVFTFGHGQPHFGKYHVVTAATEDECREKMFHRFGAKWSMMYETKEQAGAEEFNLTEIK